VFSRATDFTLQNSSKLAHTKFLREELLNKKLIMALDKGIFHTFLCFGYKNLV